jgi:hypothetical protein
MSEQATEQSRNAIGALEGARALLETIDKNESNVVETDLITRVDVTDDAGQTFKATHLKIVDMGKIDSDVATVSLQISGEAGVDGKRPTLFGLLHDKGDDIVELWSTDTIMLTSEVSETPAASAYHPASETLGDTYDDEILFNAKRDTQVLLDGRDDDDPDGYGSVIETLNESRATVPGIAYAGKLLVDHSRE